MAKETEDAPVTHGDEATPSGAYRRRLGEAAGSLGRPLREIEGESVVVIGITFEADRKVRSLADDPANNIKRGDLVSRDAVIFTVESSDPQGTRYFSFSPSLVDKMRPVDPNDLPMDARFVKVPLEGGTEVWNVE